MLLLALGWLSVGLGAVGILVPGLPTTPFLILAAACFARSSDRFYGWIVASPVFGPLVLNWRETRSIPARAKVAAIALIVIVGGSSVVFFVSAPWAKIAMGGTLVGLSGWILRVPTAAPTAREPASPTRSLPARDPDRSRTRP